MSKLISGLKYVIDAVIDLIKYIIDASKLTLKKIKIILFTIYSGIFTFNYFFHHAPRGLRMPRIVAL